MIGDTISHYKIEEKLGAGGMGVVYKARDVLLDRFVALKFLPAQVGGNGEEKQRFILEAKTASSLDHTNICTIYEIDQTVDGQMFIAMAYYDGETLKEKIARGVLTTNAAIDLAMQIAQGLARAHKAGIIHRDIKPENIIVTKEGAAKIVDFGLAKLASSTKITESDTTMGTLAYMSPELLHGENSDHRADIWSLGVVLYEMLTGRLPFHGEPNAAMSLAYAILNHEPEPLARYKAGLSAEMQRIMDKALDKDPETRFQSADEFLADLKRERKTTSQKINLIPSVPKIKKRTKLSWLLALPAAVLAAWAVYQFSTKPVPPDPAMHKQVTFVGDAALPAISPDGQFIAYVVGKSGEQRVMVQDLLSGKVLEVYPATTRIGSLLWSSDGAELMFWIMAVDSIFKTVIVPRLGGPARTLMAAGDLSWSPDRRRIASLNWYTKKIFLTTVGTEHTSAIDVAGDFIWMHELEWSPAGDRLLFLTEDGDGQYTIWTIKVDGSQQQPVISDSVMLPSPRWSAASDAIYFLRWNGQTKDLMKINIDRASGKAVRGPRVLHSGLQAGNYFTISKDNRRMLYTRESMASNLWLVQLDRSQKTTSLKTTKLTTSTSSLGPARISPDGQWLAFSMGDPSVSNLFVIPLAGGAAQQLTFLSSFNTSAVWSPDGNEIAFGSNQNGKFRVWKIPARGGTPQPFAQSELSSNSIGLSWAPGKHILYQRPGNRNFHFINPQTGEETPLLRHPELGWTFIPRYSPDGSQVVLFWNRKGTREDGLWVLSLADSSQTLIYRGSLLPIEWSADGRWIFAWDPNHKPFEIRMIPVHGGPAKTLVTLPFENISPDNGIAMTPNSRQIVCTVVASQSDIWVMETFDPEIK